MGVFPGAIPAGGTAVPTATLIAAVAVIKVVK